MKSSIVLTKLRSKINHRTVCVLTKPKLLLYQGVKKRLSFGQPIQYSLHLTLGERFHSKGVTKLKVMSPLCYIGQRQISAHKLNRHLFDIFVMKGLRKRNKEDSNHQKEGLLSCQTEFLQSEALRAKQRLACTTFFQNQNFAKRSFYCKALQKPRKRQRLYLKKRVLIQRRGASQDVSGSIAFSQQKMKSLRTPIKTLPAAKHSFASNMLPLALQCASSQLTQERFNQAVSWLDKVYKIDKIHCLIFDSRGYITFPNFTINGVNRHRALSLRPSTRSCRQPEKQKMIRPLLDFQRESITMVCQDFQIPVYPDQSNTSVKYSRNRLRKQIIPGIKYFINPQVESSLFKLAELLSKEQSFLYSVLQNT